MDRDAIFEGVRAIVADSLAVDEAGIARSSRLIADLGADSLDFIDMIFAIEKRFGVSARDAELSFLTRLDFSSPTVMKEGFLTRETIDRLRGWLPALDDVPDPARVTPRQLFSLIAVETLCLTVERKLLLSGT